MDVCVIVYPFQNLRLSLGLVSSKSIQRVSLVKLRFRFSKSSPSPRVLSRGNWKNEMCHWSPRTAVKQITSLIELKFGWRSHVYLENSLLNIYRQARERKCIVSCKIICSNMHCWVEDNMFKNAHKLSVKIATGRVSRGSQSHDLYVDLVRLNNLIHI